MEVDKMQQYEKAHNWQPLIEQGVSLLSVGQLEKALMRFKQALDIKPDDAVALYNAGVASQTMGQLNHAVDYYLKAAALAPDFTATYYNLGRTYQDLNQDQQAVSTYTRLLELDPNYADAVFQLGNLFKKTGNNARALEAFGRVLKLRPDHAEALNNMGIIWREGNQMDKAAEFFEKSLGMKPDLAEAHYNLGICHQKRGDYKLGIKCFRKALANDPQYAPARWLNLLALPMIYENQEDIKYYRRQFSKNLETLVKTTPLETTAEKRSALEGIGCTTNFYLSYQGRNDRDLQEQYGQFVCRVMAANYPRWSQPKHMNRPDPGEKIRVGYVSSFICNHTVGIFLSGWVENHDFSQFDIHCYHLGGDCDALTERLKRFLYMFYHFPNDLVGAAKQIENDRIQVLVFADIGMNPITMQLGSLRLAPVQCKGWGHPVTTGLPTIDYYLSSDLMEPDKADEHYSEKLIRLPDLALCYNPPVLPSNPKSRTALGLPENGFIFLSTQSLFKYLPQHDDIYPIIAAKVPNAKFVFIQNNSNGVTFLFKKRLLRAFDRMGLDGAGFIHIVPRMKYTDFLSLNISADVLLDTFDWSGGRTSLEALSCGLPVVTCPGKLMRGRHTYAMLKKINVTDTVAGDKNEFCAIAIRLATDRVFYSRIKSRIRKNRARLYHDRAFLTALEAFYRRASTVDRHRQRDVYESGNARILFEKGTEFLESNNWEQAIHNLRRAIAAAPDGAPIHNNLGKAYMCSGNRRQARTHIKKALKLDPYLSEAWFNMAELAHSEGCLEASLGHYKKATELNPQMSAAYNNMGNVFKKQKHYTPAINAYHKVIELAPELAEGHYNLGSTYRLNGQYGEAIDALARAVQLRPEYAEAWNNLGLTLKNVRDMDRALAYFNRALQIEPDLAEARWNRSFVYMLKGDWPSGWEDFEWRFNIPQWRSIYPHRIDGRRWNGESAAGRTILVHDEQGLGDTLQFIRFLPMVKEKCGRVILETRPALAPLLSDAAGVDEIVLRNSDTPSTVPFDRYVPLMSLARIFKATPENPGHRGPYLKAPEAKIEQWRNCLPGTGLKVGLVWAGRPEHLNDANRSCDFELFTSLFQLQDIQFFGLQKGAAASQADDAGWPNFTNMGEKLDSFADSAGLLAHLDMVITVDTSVAHLAGAMGCPVWVLIPNVPDWRWMLSGPSTPWYASMRLFRQSCPKDWGGVIMAIKTSLIDFRRKIDPNLAEQQP